MTTCRAVSNQCYSLWPGGTGPTNARPPIPRIAVEAPQPIKPPRRRNYLWSPQHIEPPPRWRPFARKVTEEYRCSVINEDDEDESDIETTCGSCSETEDDTTVEEVEEAAVVEEPARIPDISEVLEDVAAWPALAQDCSEMSSQFDVIEPLTPCSVASECSWVVFGEAPGPKPRETFRSALGEIDENVPMPQERWAGPLKVAARSKQPSCTRGVSYCSGAADADGDCDLPWYRYAGEARHDRNRRYKKKLLARRAKNKGEQEWSNVAAWARQQECPDLQ